MEFSFSFSGDVISGIFLRYTLIIIIIISIIRRQAAVARSV
jgi:hypothetical protein